MSASEIKFVRVFRADMIGMEAETDEGLAVIGMHKWRNEGPTVTVMAPRSVFPSPSGFEMDLPTFRAMIEEYFAELDQWEADLRSADGAWSRHDGDTANGDA